MDIDRICADLHAGADRLSQMTTAQKNRALESVTAFIDEDRESIIAANMRDVEKANAGGMTGALIERLALDDRKINDILDSMRIVINQEDPIGEETAGWTAPAGMQIKQVRVPLGVVAIIYESRPNVTVDAFCLAYKSGNAILLRGSSGALNSNKALTAAIKEGLVNAGTDGVPDAIELCESTDHSDVDQILNAVGLIDCVLPRGGANLIKNVVEKARVPVIQTGSGVCHLYVDDSADLDMAARIAENAKIQRPGACNAIECILVNKSVAVAFLPKLAQQLKGRVQLRADETCWSLLKPTVDAMPPSSRWGSDILIHAADDEYGHEFLDLVCLVHAVSSVEEAIEYINAHNTKHSESIVTNNRIHARMFQQKIDAACVYVNSSTRFTDGGEFGFGAELGISTQKLHARGPMGIKALTTTKYLIDGEGQIR